MVQWYQGLAEETWWSVFYTQSHISVEGESTPQSCLLMSTHMLWPMPTSPPHTHHIPMHNDNKLVI